MNDNKKQLKKYINHECNEKLRLKMFTEIQKVNYLQRLTSLW